MLPRRNRMNKQDVALLFKQGTTKRGGAIMIKGRPTTAATAQARFCIIFAKTIKCNGVERNRLRRQTYAIIHAHLDEIAPGRDYGIILTDRIAHLTDSARRKAIEQDIVAILAHSKTHH